MKEQFKAYDKLINERFDEYESQIDRQVDHVRSKLEGEMKKRAQRENDFTSERMKT